MISIIFFVVGVLSSQKINIVGEIYLGEIFCFLVLVFKHQSIAANKDIRTMMLLLFIWFVAQLISDLYNHSEIIDAFKGILVPVFVLTILLGMTTMFRRNLKYLPIFLLGVSLGLIVNRILNSHEFFIENPWKWGVGYSIALFFFTFVEFYVNNYKRFIIICGSLFYVAFSFFNSSRSLALFFMVAAILFLFSPAINRNKYYNYLSRSPFGGIQFVLAVLAVLVVLDRSFVFLFSYEPFLDLLPNIEAEKYKVQAQSQFGVILGGRTELFVSLDAFFDSPIFGHGSWPQNPEYVYQRIDRVDAAGSSLIDISIKEANISSFLIPTHSYIMGALVWGGFFAGLFWLKTFATIGKGFLNIRVVNSPLLLYISIALIWDVLFSPFGADARWISTMLLSVYYLILSNKNGMMKSQ